MLIFFIKRSAVDFDQSRIVRARPERVANRAFVGFESVCRKLDMLSRAGPDLPTQLLAGTGVAHIYKLRVKGNVQLRPMLCRGPVENDAEFTMLYGAIEVGDALQPANAAERAATIREEILADPNTRRCDHERID